MWLAGSCTWADKMSGSGATASADTPDSTSSAMTDTSSFSSTSGAGANMGSTGPCDPWNDDCPPEFKCMPHAEPDDGMWTGSRCSPLAPMPAGEGEPCAIDGYLMSGVDDCDRGLICWYADENGHGQCIAMCIGSLEMPACPDPLTSCAIDATGFLRTCWGCDPLIQDCWAPMEICVPNALTHGFLCTQPGNSGPGEPCIEHWDCQASSFCSSNSDLCTDGSCCVQFCDLESMTNDCPPTTKCSPYFTEPVPAKYTKIGYCAP